MQFDREAQIKGNISRGRRSSPSFPFSDAIVDRRGQTASVNRRTSEAFPLLFSPAHINNNQPSSPRPALFSTSPLYTPAARSPDSVITRAMATSPQSSLRLSPVFRSASRRRFSEQGFSPGNVHHLNPGPSFGSFVGSYEESLLSGRMSSLPSKPIMFDAELGVLGLGKCKTSLKCPPHVNFNFPAHFYSLDGASDKEGSLSSGTPYVGIIDVEGHYLDALVSNTSSALGISQSPLTLGNDSPSPLAPLASPLPNPPINMSSDVPSFPGYRIPPKGQIQLIIKNPNLTAVKLFLIPYDFTDMPAGTKTFIRQKSHVASPGPGVESADTISSSTSPSSFRRSHGRSSIGEAGRETLRYAVHLHFCALPSTRISKSRQSEPGFNAGGLDRLKHRRKSEEHESKNKKQGTIIYLHKQIRVVFTARAPDRSEKLRIVTETPGGSDGNHQNIYSTYFGPSEEWKEAKRMTRASRSAARHQVEKASVRMGGLAEEMSADDLASPNFHDILVNSDPNGEKWASGHLTEEDGVDDAQGLDIPLTSRSPRREQEEEAHQSIKEATIGSAPAKATSFASAAFKDGGTSRSSTTVVAPIQRTVSSDSETAEDDRALLEQWHASLALRSQSNRPASPIASTSRNRPTSPLFAKRPVSPSNNFFSLINRSGSSIGSAGHSSGGGSSSCRSHRRTSSAARHSIRPLVPQKTGDGPIAASPGVSLAQPLEASLDLESANGTLDQQPQHQSDRSRRPILIRQLSSQVQMSAVSNGRDSPAA